MEGSLLNTETVTEETPHLTCADCGEEIEETDYINADCEAICESCSGNYQTCERCDCTVACDDCGEVRVSRRSTETWCEDCRDCHATRCDSCRDYVPDDETTNVSGDSICHRCYEDGDYCTCERCGDAFHSDDGVYREHRDAWFCDSCDPGEEDDCDEIHDYEYKPYPRFFGKGPRYFGVELEVNTDSVSDHAESALDMLGEDHVYLKKDGSLSSGFEIVTHPHSLAAQRELWSDWTAPDGMTSHRSGECGLHVHVSRSAVTEFHLGKILVFVNHPDNTALVETLAQRSSSKWAKRSPKKVSDVREHDYDRYQAVNLRNRATIEFRIFRGNTRRERILKAVETVDAILTWTKDCGISHLTASAFTTWMSKQKKEYPALFGFMVERGLIETPKARKGKVLCA